jgi:hypothetical protein
LALTADHRVYELLTSIFEIGQPTPLIGKEITIEPSQAAQRSYSLPVSQQFGRPLLATVDQSPVNGRVAFALLFLPAPSFWQPLLRLLKLRGSLTAVESLWIGDPITGRVQEVGHVRVYSDFIGYGPIGDVRWLPDGKHLSFLSGHELFTVPAD